MRDWELFYHIYTDVYCYWFYFIKKKNNPIFKHNIWNYTVSRGVGLLLFIVDNRSNYCTYQLSIAIYVVRITTVIITIRACSSYTTYNNSDLVTFVYLVYIICVNFDTLIIRYYWKSNYIGRISKQNHVPESL